MKKNHKHNFFLKIKMKGEKLIELGKESLKFTKILRGEEIGNAFTFTFLRLETKKKRWNVSIAKDLVMQLNIAK